MKKAKAKGRPKAKWKSRAAAERIFSRISNGESLRAICRAEGWPLTTVDVWLNTEFSEQYTQAREARADYFFDEIMEIADGVDADKDAVARAKLRIDTRKFAMARMAPKKYSDNVNLTMEGTVKHNGKVEFAPNDCAIQGIAEILNTVVGPGEDKDMANTRQK